MADCTRCRCPLADSSWVEHPSLEHCVKALGKTLDALRAPGALRLTEADCDRFAEEIRQASPATRLAETEAMVTAVLRQIKADLGIFDGGEFIPSPEMLKALRAIPPVKSGSKS